MYSSENRTNPLLPSKNVLDRLRRGGLGWIARPHSEIKMGVRCLSFIGIVADLDGCTMFHALETVLFIEGDILFVLWHPFEIQVVLVFFLDAFQHLPGDALPLIIGMHKDIVDLCQHFAVIQYTDQTDQPVSIPDSQHRGGL